jgi:hypothetical protein
VDFEAVLVCLKVAKPPVARGRVGVSACPSRALWAVFEEVRAADYAGNIRHERNDGASEWPGTGLVVNSPERREFDEDVLKRSCRRTHDLKYHPR